MDGNMSVVYENENIIALNKPAGVNFDWVLEFKKSLIPAHRLDKDTSGIILFAKNKTWAEHLKNLFQTRQVKKIYYALVVGNVKQNSGTIEFSIGRSKRTPLKRISVGKKVGKLREAETYYEVERRFKDFTFLRVMPKTGRTHQIRSHLAAIHHPVVCDKLYGGRKIKCPTGLARQFLHAFSIEFEGLRLEADLPNDLKKTLDMLT